MNAFTCTGSYAILILCGIKRTENRSAWPEPHEGRAAISCSKSFCKEEYGQFIAWASVNLPPEDFEKLPAWREVKDWPGKVVGVCDYAARARGTRAAARRGHAPKRRSLGGNIAEGNPKGAQACALTLPGRATEKSFRTTISNEIFLFNSLRSSYAIINAAEVNMINRITVKGFKSIKELMGFDLRTLNVIVGANGAGKSNFIQIFHMVHAMSLKGFQDFILTAGGADVFPFNGIRETQKIEMEFSFGDNSYQFTLLPTADEKFVISEARRYKEHNWQSYGSGMLESRLVEEKDERSFAYPGSPGIGYYIYNAISRWTVYHFHDTSATAPMRRSEIVEDCERLRTDGGNIAPFLRALRDGDAACRESYKRIVEAVRLVTPFFEDFRLDVTKVGMADKVKLSWRQKGSDYPFQPYHLSDGSIRFMCLAVALLQPCPPSTIIIDEPELGLHPMAISLLAELIKTAARHTQVIVATQSPALIDHFGVEDLIVARRKSGASVFERLDENGLKVWLEDYSLGELWQKNIISGGPVHE